MVCVGGVYWWCVLVVSIGGGVYWCVLTLLLRRTSIVNTGTVSVNSCGA